MASRLWTLPTLWLGLACSSEPPADPSLGSGGTTAAGTGGAGGTSTTGGGGAQPGGAGAGGSASGGAGTGGSSGASAGSAGSAGAGASASGVGCAGAALCWDFEEGSLPAGFVVSRDEFEGELLVDATRPHGGTYSLHAKDLSGGTPGTAGGPKKSIKYTLPGGFGPTLWGRAFVYTTPARPVSHAGLFNARYPRPGNPSTAQEDLDWYEVATYQEKYMGIWHPPEPPGFPEWVLVSGTPLVLDAWACLEWLFDGANGENLEAADPRVWLDGSELAWPEQFVFSEPAGAAKPVMEKAENFTMIETGVVMYQGLSVPTSWWIDDLAIGPQRIGCD
jgi:hypothetical protein